MLFQGTCFNLKFSERTHTKSFTKDDTTTKTHSKSFTAAGDTTTRYHTATKTFYTARSDLNRPLPDTIRDVMAWAENHSNLRAFTVAELQAATGNFSLTSKIGEGGFGSVFKGVITSLEPPFDEIEVAVKFSHYNIKYDERAWITEINVLGVAEHPNIIKLIGYCNENDALLLVYEYMVNGSVKDHLFAESETPLSWNMRLKVAQDAARALVYLHEQMDIKFIFRDFKASNILLDDHWNAKLSDFGGARLGPDEGDTHVSTNFVGTNAYADPDYFKTGQTSLKSDVWSYGVFLYELMTSKRVVVDKDRPNKEPRFLQELRKSNLDTAILQRMIDPRLKDNYPLESAQKLSLIASSCLKSNPKRRPDMSQVLELVSQLIEVPSQASNPVNETNNGSIVNETNSILNETTNGSIVNETINGSIVNETNNGSIVNETINGSIVNEANNGSIVNETINGSKKDSTDIRRRLPSCLSCFRSRCVQ
ncbi:putative protein kinase RLK-Pelle-RLCK-VIIa-2 family [Helianthus debilis subsp. tardiflorus]